MTGNENESHNQTIELARQYNRETRDAVVCNGHRRRIMQLIEHACSNVSDRRPSITIIGPGNCKDIDLPAIADRCREIQFVDLDTESVTAATNNVALLKNDAVESVCQIKVCCPFDFAAPLSSCTRADFEAGGLSELIKRLDDPLADQVPSSLLHQTDIVISTCVLSQIINAVAHVAGFRTAQTPELLKAIRSSHFRRMAALLRPHGTAILVTDFVSSDTLPMLQDADERNLQPLITQALQRGNFFSGLHPGIVVQDLQQFAAANNLTLPKVTPPWRWQLGPRSYAVFALSVQKPF